MQRTNDAVRDESVLIAPTLSLVCCVGLPVQEQPYQRTLALTVTATDLAAENKNLNAAQKLYGLTTTVRNHLCSYP